MAATARLVLMMDAAAKKRLESEARKEKVSVAEIARRRLAGGRDPDTQATLDAIARLGKTADQVFAGADARVARESQAEERHEAMLATARKDVEDAFARWSPASGKTRRSGPGIAIKGIPL